MNVLAALTVGAACVSYAAGQTAAKSDGDWRAGKLSAAQIVDGSTAAAGPAGWSESEGKFPVCGITRTQSTQRIDEYPRPVNVATAAGAKVARVTVIEWRHGAKRRTWGNIVDLIQRVWAAQLEEGRPQGAPGVIDGIPWAEVVYWSVSATLEFEGSKTRGCVATDGVHLYLQDVNGRLWIDRLRPAGLRGDADLRVH